LSQVFLYFNKLFQQLHQRKSIGQKNII